jgi:hypothetical protein
MRIGVRQNYRWIVAGNILAELKKEMVCGGSLLKKKESGALFG